MRQLASGLALGLLFLVAAPLSALAQLAAAPAPAPAVVGTVTAIEGPSGAVLVIRANRTYSLKVGDQLIAGDQVFTRFNGSVAINGSGCAVLPQASFMVMTGAGCSTISGLTASQTIGGVAIGGQSALSFPLLAGAAGAVAVAASASSGGDDPASP
jgi:hypothetical protein